MRQIADARYLHLLDTNDKLKKEVAIRRVCIKDMVQRSAKVFVNTTSSLDNSAVDVALVHVRVRMIFVEGASTLLLSFVHFFRTVQKRSSQRLQRLIETLQFHSRKFCELSDRSPGAIAGIDWGPKSYYGYCWWKSLVRSRWFNALVPRNWAGHQIPVFVTIV